jgi:hypothetical protein
MLYLLMNIVLLFHSFTRGNKHKPWLYLTDTLMCVHIHKTQRAEIILLLMKTIRNHTNKTFLKEGKDVIKQRYYHST